MFDSAVRENIIILTKAYARAEKVSIATVSKRAYGQSRFLEDFAAGKKSISVQKLDQMIEWFETNWPKDTEMPLLRPIFMWRMKS